MRAARCSRPPSAASGATRCQNAPDSPSTTMRATVGTLATGGATSGWTNAWGRARRSIPGLERRLAGHLSRRPPHRRRQSFLRRPRLRSRHLRRHRPRRLIRRRHRLRRRIRRLCHRCRRSQSHLRTRLLIRLRHRHRRIRPSGVDGCASRRQTRPRRRSDRRFRRLRRLRRWFCWWVIDRRVTLQ